MGDYNKDKSIPAFWRIVASMRFGLVLMFLMAGAATIGVLLPRGLSGQGDFFGQIVRIVGLDKVFTTWWFRGLALLLAVNVLVCQVYRLRAVLYVLRFPKMTIGAMDRLKCYETFFSRDKVEDVVDRATQAMLANRYRVMQSEDDEQFQIYADKQRLALLGPVLAHFGALILFCGIIWTTAASEQGTFITGTQEDPYSLAKLEDRYLESTKDLALKVDDIKTISSADAADIRGTLRLYRNGQVVKTGEIGYNDPFIYNNRVFHLLNNVPTVFISTIYNNQQTVKLIRPTENENAIQVPGSDPPMYVTFSDIRPSKNPRVTYTIVEYNSDPVVYGQGFMYLGKPIPIIKYPNFSVSLIGYEDSLKLRISDYSGVSLVVGGALVLLLGMFMSLFLRYRKIWLTVTPDSEQAQVSVGGYSSKHRVNFNSEFAALVEEIKG